jgi:Zn finger protein HypA/HybF involved in hydrogenase expression
MYVNMFKSAYIQEIRKEGFKMKRNVTISIDENIHTGILKLLGQDKNFSGFVETMCKSRLVEATVDVANKPTMINCRKCGANYSIMLIYCPECGEATILNQLKKV